MTEQATFHVRDADGVPAIEIRGEVDISNCDQFRSFLKTAGGQASPAIVVSLENVLYLDSHALAALVDFSKRLATNRRRLVLVAGRQTPAGKILGISNLGLAIPVCDSVDEALTKARNG
jgi:anti-anti-sigma factor